MNNRKSSIDGFITRRPGSQIGERHTTSVPASAVRRKELKAVGDTRHAEIGAPRRGKQQGRPISSTGRSDIDDSLRQLDEPDQKIGRAHV